MVGEIVSFAGQQGVRFSKAISYGNALDFNECDYLDYFAQDPETEIILLYRRGEGRKRFPEALKKAAALNRSYGQGRTGKCRNPGHGFSYRLPGRVPKDLGVPGQTVRGYQCLHPGRPGRSGRGLQFLPPATGRNLAVLGGSGGSSVLSADQCEEAGLEVIPLPQDIRDKLKESGSPIWDWIGNPADFSISMGDHEAAFQIGFLMAEHPSFEALMVFVHGPWGRQFKNFSLENHLQPYKQLVSFHKPTVMVFQEMRGHDKEDENLAKIRLQIKDKLIEWKMSVYPSIDRAARALSGFNEGPDSRFGPPCPLSFCCLIPAPLFFVGSGYGFFVNHLLPTALKKV